MKAKTAAKKKPATKGAGTARKGKAGTTKAKTTKAKRSPPAGRTARVRRQSATVQGTAPWGYTNEGVPKRKPGVKPKS